MSINNNGYDRNRYGNSQNGRGNINKTDTNVRNQNARADEDKNDLYEESVIDASVGAQDREETVSLVSMLFDIFETLAIATCAIVLLFTFVFRIAIVSGESMERTLTAGDMLIVSNIGYKPKYGDIVVLQKVDSALGDEAVVKRIIATEGQTISVNDETNEVTVDGVVIDESGYVYIDIKRHRYSDMQYPITLGKGEVFVMGDNRIHSTDSRSYNLGIIDERCIFGRVIMRVYPLKDIKFFDRMEDK